MQITTFYVSALNEKNSKKLAPKIKKLRKISRKQKITTLEFFFDQKVREKTKNLDDEEKKGGQKDQKDQEAERGVRTRLRFYKQNVTQKAENQKPGS